MSDSLWYCQKISNHEKAYHEYLSCLLNYLKQPSAEGRMQCISNIEYCASTFQNRFSANEMKQDFERIVNGDLGAWKELNEALQSSFFKQFPEFISIFIELAQKRNIGKWQWVI